MLSDLENRVLATRWRLFAGTIVAKDTQAEETKSWLNYGLIDADERNKEESGAVI